MNDETTTKIHPWQRCGLGIAPFQYVGYRYSAYQAVPGDPNCPLQPGSSCDYCGQGIFHVCQIRDANGREFKVGCDCVKKVSADTNKRLVKAVDADVKAAKKAAQFEREDRRIAEAVEILQTNEAIREELAQHPHRVEWLAKKGLTRLDHWAWILEHGGRSGRMQIVRALDKMAK